MKLPRIGAQSGLRFARRLSVGLATTAVLGSGLIAITTTPAAAVSRDSIVSVAQSQLNNSSRNHEQPLGSGCNYYTGYFRTWKPSSGCPATDGVQWRDSDWCADFSKYVWKNAGVPYADVPETSGGVLTGWASSFKDYGTTHGTWHTRGSGYTPQPGDALVFDWDQNGVIDHVGIVKSANSSTVYTIEGNSGDRVKENSYSRTNIDIVGYSSPVGASDTDDPAPRPVVDPQAGRLVDFDGDGKPDFLGLGASGDDLWFIPNTSAPGAPARGQSIPMSTGWKTVTKYWLTDYDGDGKTDVLGLNGTDQMLAWINTSSPGHPSASAAVNLGTQWSTLSKIVVADFTGDGKVDIAGVDAGTGDQFWVVPNTSAPGAPARGQSMQISTGWKTVTRFWVTDYDGDGKTDLLGLNGTDQMFVWRNRGTAVPSFDQYVDLGTQWSTLSKIVIADFTGDGKVDIAGVDAGTGDQFWVVPNTSTFGTPARGQSMLISTGWKTVTTFLVTDYDRDGKTDLLGLNGTDQMLAWRSKGTAVPSFEPYADLGTQWSTISHIPTAQ
ncbi:hypothetical protein Aple_073060 [Acrocarpospora pleiomorpha]|uniref:Peptidase C51 domain-containing protein n=1 Tax=Acrocarpospora pleiomorpha TaxID=90975 RepID=A0A5M3XSX4_9ACTN|nr:FG-GAP-like repeat-containing protein [Acrocarpospora pleiomorpha]GES24407.1 hypothetical protein Aple_073060 [Acrocarpospora pleiomorpha]